MVEVPPKVRLEPLSVAFAVRIGLAVGLNVVKKSCMVTDRVCPSRTAATGEDSGSVEQCVAPSHNVLLRSD